jgi:ABC-2 type transport system permease protein
VTTDQTMKPVEEIDYLSGFRNMLRKENSSWLSTHRWLKQSLIWLVFVNGIVSLVLYLNSSVHIGAQSSMGPPSGVELFFMMLGSITPYGVVILTQSDVVGEKQSGTAEWVLSAPLSREAFLLSKLVVNSMWIFAVMVFLQGVAFNLILLTFGLPMVPVLNMVAGLATNCLHLFFWLTLTLMLGASFQGRGSVLGIPLAFLILQDLIIQLAATYMPWLIPLLPKSFMVQGLQLAQGGGIESMVPAVAVAIWSIIFMAAAIWRFRHEEF